MARRPLLTAALCALLAAVVYVGAVGIPALREADLRTLEGFMGLWTVPGASYAGAFVGLFDPLPFALLTGALLAGAVLAGRRREAAAALVAIVGAGVTTQVLKPLLAVQRDFPLAHEIGAEAYPSGHTTAVMSFALALAIVAAPRLRPLAAAAGALLSVGTVYSILIVGAHYPSDVIGGLLVATAWACIAVAALRVEARPSLRDLAGGPALAGALLAAAGAVAVSLRPGAAVAYAAANTTFVAGALAIAAVALVLTGSVPAPTRARIRRRSSR
jgi:membrane-associated phospholipid phosphatase